MNSVYQPAEIEAAAQQFWHSQNSFRAKEDLSKEKFYCLSMLPYPSGELHMGHVRNYTIGDVISRYQIMQGKNVLQPMGWDSFGLPAENAAIERKLPPAKWTHKNIDKMREQLQRLGYALDWSREISTCEPEYYHWEQWLFVRLYKKGLVYKKNSMVNWDPVDETVLANEQVVDGKGWRSGAPVERREIPQWFFKITDYADELLDGLDNLTGWPEQVITMQRNWIGRSFGVHISFKLADKDTPLEVYTTRPDTIYGSTYLAIATDHPLSLEAAKQDKDIKKFLEQAKHTSVSEAEIAKQEKQGIFSNFYAINPLTNEEIPIWITNFVLMEYGTGAVMSVPAHDERDHEFALKYGLPLKPVVRPEDGEWDYAQAAFTERGILFDSGKFDGLSGDNAFNQIADYLQNEGVGERQTNYRLRDWGISRQRYWGTPIPIINCPHCGPVPVPEADLPVVLPTDLIPTGHGSPLAKNAKFCNTTCPECGKKAKRETDTMDTFVESSWYYARYCSADQDQIMLDDRAKYWAPVDQYIGGIEHAVMHLLYARFMHKILRDEDLINSNEPFVHLLTQGMVLKDGTKMSKSKGNVVAPIPLIEKYGADTVRLFSMFAAPPEQSLEWSDSGVDGSYRFLKKLWQYAMEVQPSLLPLNQQGGNNKCPLIEDAELQAVRKQVHEALKQANFDYERQQYNTVVSACMIILNIISKLSPKEEMQTFVINESLSFLLRLLAPITPHISHILWQQLGLGENILNTSWPKPNSKAMQTNVVEMVVQINGKLRGRITVSRDSDKDHVEKAAVNHDNIQRYLIDKTIKKVIVVPGKLINIVVSDN